MAGSADESMMINRLLTAVVAAFNGALPNLKVCEVHGGRFDVAELKRMATHSPGIFLAVIGIPALKNGGDGRRVLTLQLTAFVVARDVPRVSRDLVALNMVQTLMGIIPENNWGIGKGGGMAYQVTATNLYSGALDRTGSALWGISWRQDIAIGEDIWSGGVLPDELYVGIEPETGQSNQGKYERLV